MFSFSLLLIKVPITNRLKTNPLNTDRLKIIIPIGENINRYRDQCDHESSQYFIDKHQSKDGHEDQILQCWFVELFESLV